MTLELRTWAAIWLAASAIGAGIGFIGTPGSGDEIVQPRPRAPQPPILGSDGPPVSASTNVLRSLGYGVPPPAPPPPPPPPRPRVFRPPPPPPPPPPPDAGVVFRAEVAAIVADGPGYAVLLHGGGGTRLKAGAPWRDGWTIAEIGLDRVVLKRDGDQRVVAFYGPATAGAPLTPARTRATG